MALKILQPDTPSQRQLVIVDRSASIAAQPVKTLTEGKTRAAAATTTAASPCASAAAATSRRTARSTSSAASRHAGDRRAASNTIRTAPASSRWSNTRTASWPTSWRRSGCRRRHVVAGEHVDVKPGNAMPLGNIPIGTIVHNVELKIGKGGQIARSAGTYAQIVGRDGDYVILRLNSAEQRLVHGRCMATIGAVSNPDNMNILDRQGRPQALDGPPAAQSRRSR
jgi:large subunit ribosomal protein L2